MKAFSGLENLKISEDVAINNILVEALNIGLSNMLLEGIIYRKPDNTIGIVDNPDEIQVTIDSNECGKRPDNIRVIGDLMMDGRTLEDIEAIMLSSKLQTKEQFTHTIKLFKSEGIISENNTLKPEYINNNSE